MRKSVILAVSVLCLSLCMTSCYDAHEINDYVYVYSIGLEKGSKDKLRMTIQVPTFKQEKGGGQNGQGSGEGAVETQEKDGYVTISLDAPTFFAGVNLVNTFLPRTVNYMHAKYMVISEDLAREGVGDYINGFIRNREIRRTLNIIICKGAASEFIKENTPVIGTALSKTQADMMRQSQETGLFFSVTYGEMFSESKSTYGQPTAILAAVNHFDRYRQTGSTERKGFRTSGDYYAGELVRIGGGKLEFMGTAVFNGDKMVGELNGDETRMVMVIKGKFHRGFFAFPDPMEPGKAITLEVRQEKPPKIKVRLGGDKPVIHVQIELEADIVAIQSTVNYESSELKPLIEAEFKEFIKDQMDHTIKKCQGLKADVFGYGFGLDAAAKFSTIQEWEAFRWKEKFPTAQITTDVEFHIRRTGTMVKSSQIRPVMEVEK